MNLEDISTQLLFTTVPIWTEREGTKSSATAFIYNFPVPNSQGNSVPMLITNHHVVEGCSRGMIELVERQGSEPNREKRIRVELQISEFELNSALDIALYPLGRVLNQLETEGRPAFFRAVSPELIPGPIAISELAALEEIVFIGYPSGLRDDKNANPLIRRGITSTPVWNDFQGTPTFLIDAGVFPGSSGSPVFVLNQGAYATKEGLSIGSRVLFLGVIRESMVRLSQAQETYLGLGRVVRSTELASYVESVVTPHFKSIPAP